MLELLFIVGIFMAATGVVLGWFVGNVFTCTFLTLIGAAVFAIMAASGATGPALLLCAMVIGFVWAPHWLRH
jgi:hypothetical protein